MKRKGYIYIVLTALLYSTSEVALKFANGAFQPMQLTVLRVLLSGLVLFPFAVKSLKERGVKLNKSDILYFSVLGFLCVTLHMSFYQTAISNANASVVSSIYSGNPIFAVLFGYMILKEPIHRNNWIAILLEVIGILCIVNPAHIAMSVTGFIQIICATILFSLYGVLGKLRVDKVGSLVISDFALLFGGIELFALILLGKIPAVSAVFGRVGLGLFTDVSLLSGFTVKSTLVFAYVSVCVTALGFLFLMKAVEYTSASEASFTYFVKPVLASVFAVLFLNETIAVNQLVGILFFMMASFISIIPNLVGADHLRLEKIPLYIKAHADIIGLTIKPRHRIPRTH